MAYESKYQERINAGLKKLSESGSFTYGQEKPTFTSRYSETIDRLMEDVLNTKPFTFDVEKDPSFKAYKKQFLREGQRATQNAIGAAAAANGGAVSTAGMTAATQAGDHFASQLADVVPTLYSQAYEKHLNEYTQKLQRLEMVNEQEQQDWAKHRDQVGDWEADRNFEYSVHLDDYSKLGDLLSALREADNTEYGRYMDGVTQKSQKVSQAMSLWSQNGYATPEVAAVLGVPVGTPTSDQSYTDWQKSFEQTEQKRVNAMNLWAQYGYATSEIAAVLGVPVGTPTSEQKYYDAKAAAESDEQDGEETEDPSKTVDPVQEVPKSFSGYDEAINYLTSSGVGSDLKQGLMDRSKWEQRKASGSTAAEMDYQSYPEYLAAYVAYCMDNR